MSDGAGSFGPDRRTPLWKSRALGLSGTNSTRGASDGGPVAATICCFNSTKPLRLIYGAVALHVPPSRASSSCSDGVTTGRFFRRGILARHRNPTLVERSRIVALRVVSAVSRSGFSISQPQSRLYSSESVLGRFVALMLRHRKFKRPTHSA